MLGNLIWKRGRANSGLDADSRAVRSEPLAKQGMENTWVASCALCRQCLQECSFESKRCHSHKNAFERTGSCACKPSPLDPDNCNAVGGHVGWFDSSRMLCCLANSKRNDGYAQLCPRRDRQETYNRCNIITTCDAMHEVTWFARTNVNGPKETMRPWCRRLQRNEHVKSKTKQAAHARYAHRRIAGVTSGS